MSRLTTQNYYDPDCADVDIPLDVRLSPQENAAKYFKKYTKAKTAEKYLTEQLEKGRAESNEGCAQDEDGPAFAESSNFDEGNDEDGHSHGGGHGF